MQYERKAFVVPDILCVRCSMDVPGVPVPDIHYYCNTIGIICAPGTFLIDVSRIIRICTLQGNVGRARIVRTEVYRVSGVFTL